MVSLGQLSKKDYETIESFLLKNPIDVDWWKKKDKEIHHDLNAFVLERRRFIPKNLQKYFHKGMTSYDTEEPAFALKLKVSGKIVEKECLEIIDTLKEMAEKYRYTIMYAKTHGQGAELQSFGKRCLTWLVDFQISFNALSSVLKKNLRFSKLSGAVGNYQGVSPRVEKEALDKLNLKALYGATQIMPRELYAQIAQMLSNLVGTINKIALSLRLGARSGCPIYQEGFGKKQVGSSAMPHKKNPIGLEQIKGLLLMALSYSMGITMTIETWEERAIEQSCLERVFWPDLFHVTLRALKVIKKALKKLVVYPDNMWEEIYNSCGCFATNQAKEKLKEFGFDSKEAYRAIQLAAFIIFESRKIRKVIREKIPRSLQEAEELFANGITMSAFFKENSSIREVISEGSLKVSTSLSATKEDVERWNSKLKKIFKDPRKLKSWREIFKPSYLLRREETLFKQILGTDFLATL